jgi:hypothetical protein
VPQRSAPAFFSQRAKPVFERWDELRKFAAISGEKHAAKNKRAMQRNDSRNESKIDNAGRGRPCKERPWCWQEKTALKMITEQFAESNQAVSARSVYVAMTELASDHQSDTFTVSKALIAHKAGVSVKTVERLLNGFEQLALIRIDRNVVTASAGAIKSANTYTLLPVRHSDVTPMRHGRQTVSKSDKVEESGKIFEKNNEKRAHLRSRGAPAAPVARGDSAGADFSISNLVRIVKRHRDDDSADQLCAELQPYFPDTDVGRVLSAYKQWLDEHGKQATARGVISWLLGTEPTLKAKRR